MKFLPGRMLGSTGNCTRGACTAHRDEALGAGEPCCRLERKILPGRTALKTLDNNGTLHCLLSSSLSWNRNVQDAWRYAETAGFDL